jgi:hypothetical protein
LCFFELGAVGERHDEALAECDRAWSGGGLGKYFSNKKRPKNEETVLFHGVKVRASEGPGGKCKQQY